MNKRIAIVYDWIDKWGGVERVLLTFHEMFPTVDFFTSYYDDRGASWAKDLKINTSFIQRLPKFLRRSRLASLPLYPLAFESFDFSSYDLVISVTSSFGKSIITKPETKHLCYLLTPTRYLWLYPELYLKKNILSRPLLYYINIMKRWDYVAAQRPDKIVAISQTVADRCRKYYQRKSEVIYPPFDIEYWTNIKNQISRLRQGFGGQAKFKIIENKKYFLIVSRLEPYKRVDLVIDVFNRLALPSGQRSYQDGKLLVVVGEGSQEKKLKTIARKNIYFFKKLTDEEMAWFYSNAQALITPQEEDFGYVSLEAQFFGCPVITYKKGGMLETVIEGKTGIFFDKQTEGSLLSALETFRKKSYNIRTNTGRFGPESVKRFEKKIFIRNFKRVIS